MKICIFEPCPEEAESGAMCKAHAATLPRCTDIRGKLLLNGVGQPYCTQCGNGTNPHYKDHHVVLMCWHCGGRMAREIDAKADVFAVGIMAQWNPWREEQGLELIDDEQARKCFYIIENLSEHIRENPIKK